MTGCAYIKLSQGKEGEGEKRRPVFVMQYDVVCVAVCSVCCSVCCSTHFFSHALSPALFLSLTLFVCAVFPQFVFLFLLSLALFFFLSCALSYFWLACTFLPAH